MISRLKQSVKSVLEDKKIAEYYGYLDALYVSYQDWITQREQQYRDSFLQTELVAYVVEGRMLTGVSETETVCTDMYAADLDAANADILLFTTDSKYLDAYAKTVVCDYFAKNPECVLVYGDEDEWNHNRTIRMNPWLKPDFSPDTLLQYFYYGNVIAVRRNAIERTKLQEWSRLSDLESRVQWMYRLSLELSFPVKNDKIGHVPYVLFHAPYVKKLCAGSLYDACRKGALEQLQNEALQNARVSMIIPSKDHPEILETCLESIARTVVDSDYEIIVVDNGSSPENRKKYEEMIIKYKFNYIFEPMDFNFSKMCNLGAEYANGEILLFLNDDIEAASSGWLTQMKRYALRSHVGAVGCKLYYPDSKRIQHAGITNLRLGPVHKLQFLEDVRPYYDGRNQIDHNVLAVTGACLMVRRKVWEQCGGFFENLAVAFNDVELCFRIYKKGYYNVVCNGVVMYHHESLSRGDDESEEKLIRLQHERDKMYAIHPDLYGKDPFYHPYLNNLILDTRYSFAYEYPAGADVAVEVAQAMKGGIKNDWYNECLQISLEYAGELEGWINQPDKKGEYLYFQGYQFVIGSQNPCFDRYLLCEHVQTKEVFQIPCIPTFRPDLDQNVKEGHTSLCGFSLVIEKKNLPDGRYRIGGMAKSRVSRQVLCRFTNKYMEV